MARDDLDSYRVIVTKTGKVGESLTSLFNERGVKAFSIPTLEIKGQDILMPVEDFQQAIFLSRNAVEFSLGKSTTVHGLLPEKLIAVGPGTRESLNAFGFKDVVIPENFNSEGVLELEELSEVKGQHLLLVKGEGGRGLIEKELVKRGAFCHSVDVYKRVTAQIDDEVILRACTDGDTVLVSLSSVDALLAFYTNTQKLETPPLHLFVASQRIASKAEELGYTHIYDVNSAANDKMFNKMMAYIDQE